VIVCPKHKYVFIQIPKTAGCAVRDALVAASDDPEAACSAFRQHATVSEVKSMMRPRDWDRYLKFAVVRNPWDRMVSKFWFNHGVGRQDTRFENIQVAFTNWIYEEVMMRGEFGPSAMGDMILIDDEPVLDLHLRFEYLQQDLASVFDDMPGLGTLPKLKKTHSRYRGHRDHHYSDYYNEDTEVLVRRHHHKFLKHIPYAFEKPK